MILRDFVPGARPSPEQAPPEPDYDELLGVPYLVIGDTSYYTIGALARALDRKPSTIREWERDEIIPKAFETNKSSRNGRRRLYTRKQILLLRQLAGEYGILGNHRATVRGTEFSRLAHVLFDELKKAA